MPPKTRDALTFPDAEKTQLLPYIPPHAQNTPSPSTTPQKPHITLTFATSLDSSLSLSPGTQTHLSGPLSKSMTHYLRSVHDAILIGVGTAVADDPSLNCRLEGSGGYGGVGLEGQPRPIVLDPRGRWGVCGSSKVVRLAREGRGRAPVWVVRGAVDGGRRGCIEGVGGMVAVVPKKDVGSNDQEVAKFEWSEVLDVLVQQGIRSVMIEGGGAVINDLLRKENFGIVDAVVVTIAPTWLGRGGVLVCPEERREGDVKVPVGRLRDVKWLPLGEDAVVCGRPVMES